ncbi:MAG: hypothetical protein WAV32_04440 [Halobacteriota archaeon]
MRRKQRIENRTGDEISRVSIKRLSFARAAELTGLSRDNLSFLMDTLGIEYEFLSEEDVKEERDSVDRLVQELKRIRCIMTLKR